MNETTSVDSRSSSKNPYDEHNDDPEDVNAITGIIQAVPSRPRRKAVFAGEGKCRT